MLQFGGAYQYWNIANPLTLDALNAEITRQSTIIAYGDDFKLMMLVTLPTALLLLLMSTPKATAGRGEPRRGTGLTQRLPQCAARRRCRFHMRSLWSGAGFPIESRCRGSWLPGCDAHIAS